MSDFFRLLRGVQIDNAVYILQGAGAPGTSPDTIAATVGSLYLDNVAGLAYIKNLPGSGTSKWSAFDPAASFALFNELASSPTPPVAMGNNSIALGSGAQTASTAPGSLAIGDQSLARIQGGVVQASGRFGSSGDAQAGRYLLRTVTVNSAYTQAYVDGTAGTVQLVMPDDCTWTFRMTITGHRTDVQDGHAGFLVNGVIYRGAGPATTSLQGAVDKTVIARSDASWNVTVAADTVNGALTLSVKGQNGKTIRWLGLVETVEITN